jgi:hypothetical protein
MNFDLDLDDVILTNTDPQTPNDDDDDDGGYYPMLISAE